MAKKKARKPAPAASKEVLTAIKASAEDIQKKIIARKKPTMRFPVRSLTNVKYRPDRGFFEIAGRKKERTLTVNTVKTFAQTLRMIALSKELLENDDIATKREAYYVSKNWEEGGLHPGEHGGGSDTGMPPFHPAPCGLQEDSCVCFRRRRPLRHHQHLPDAQGGVGECRASERVLLRSPGALPRHHAPGHHRLQAAHAPAERGRCQEGARCREKRPVHPAS